MCDSPPSIPGSATPTAGLYQDETNEGGKQYEQGGLKRRRLQTLTSNNISANPHNSRASSASSDNGGRSYLEGMGEYRLSCEGLVRKRNDFLYKAERRRIFNEEAIEEMYRVSVRKALDEYFIQRSSTIMSLLLENNEKLKKAENKRYMIDKECRLRRWLRTDEQGDGNEEKKQRVITDESSSEEEDELDFVRSTRTRPIRRC